MRDPFEWFVGDPIKNWRGTMTLGACVKRGSIKGYITTAHHVAVGDKFTMGLNNNLGEVLSKNDVVYGGIADASFITRTIDSEFGMTNIVRLSNGTGYPKTGGLNYSGDPIIEGSVVTFGANGGRIYATIKSISYSTLASPEGTPPYTSFSRMILLDIGSSDKIDGDSGGPVMIDLTNQGLSGEYKLVGIYKGYDTNWNPIATRWDSIVSELDVQLY